MFASLRIKESNPYFPSGLERFLINEALFLSCDNHAHRQILISHSTLPLHRYVATNFEANVKSDLRGKLELDSICKSSRYFRSAADERSRPPTNPPLLPNGLLLPVSQYRNLVSTRQSNHFCNRLSRSFEVQLC